MSGRVVVLAIATVAAFAAAAPAQIDSEATVKSGRWRGIPWQFKAQTGSDDSYCIVLDVRNREQGRSCGELDSRGITYMAAGGRPAPNYVLGLVVAKARSVKITFFDGRTTRLPTITRRHRAFDRSMRFFVAVFRCRTAFPRSFVARDAAGRIVARMTTPRPRGRPKLSC
jgi:hypothetical protein